jgi:hypothetical protein
MTIPTTTKTPITTRVKRWFTSSSTGNDENNDKAGNVGYVASLDDVDGRYDDDNYSSNNKNNNSNDNSNIAVATICCSSVDAGKGGGATARIRSTIMNSPCKPPSRRRLNNRIGPLCFLHVPT